MGRPSMMKLTFNTLIGISVILFSVCATAQEPDTSTDSPQFFVQTFCVDCHNEQEQNGEIDLQPFSQAPAKVDTQQLLSVYDQINLGQMPPVDADQPTVAERAKMLGSLERLIQGSGVVVVDKRLHPGYGNYVDHDSLFEADLNDPSSATTARIWRYSPESFSARVNRIVGRDVIKFVPVATFPVPQKGLKHPAFPYKGPAHTAKDYAQIHDFGLTETELLIGLAEELAEAQLSSGSLREYQSLAAGDAQWNKILDEHFQKLYSRNANDAEKQSLFDLQQKVAAVAPIERANQTMIAATYLRPESLFRFEIGDQSSVASGRAVLTPLEYAYAVGFALNRTGPTSELVQALEGYEEKDKSELKELIRPYLLTDAAHQRMMRFMDEYFEYGNAAYVFKDRHHRRYRPGWMIEDVEKFVARIIQEDRDVLKQLLTSREYNVRGAFNTNFAPKWFQDETNGHLFYHECYNLAKEDIGKDPEWRVLPQERAGVLCHPAWLIAFSDNTRNHAIQRGRWIQTKLLGGVIPDTPVEVDARFPEDPTLTLREKMKVVRQEDCWGCHQRMDPLGLPFEQFDLWGRHRTQELDRPVNTTGVLHGEPVKDPIELLDRLADSKRVHQVFLRHTFRFFCGRNETLADAPTLRDMEAAYHENEGSLNESLLELLVSDSFIQRQGSPPKNESSR